MPTAGRRAQREGETPRRKVNTMKRQQWGLYAVALAILVVGLVWAGVPASTLLVAGLVLACPRS